jgi:hypothetical protein
MYQCESQHQQNFGNESMIFEPGNHRSKLGNKENLEEGGGKK